MSENKFEKWLWTDDLVKEFAEKWHGHRHFDEVMNDMLPKAIEQFKSSKSSKGIDFEILTLSSNKSNCLASYDKAEEGAYNFPLSRNYSSREEFVEYFLSWPQWSIYSVKRLIDGVVFKVGDEVDSTWGKQKIEGFNADSKELVVRFGTCNNPLSKVSPLPLKKILFTTEDGVDLYDRADPVYQVLATGSWETRGLDVTNAPTGSNWWKSFSTKDKRDEYILMHKPLLSVSDVLNMPSGVFESQLKQLAKSKIK